MANARAEQVEEPSQELRAAFEQQVATAQILRVISESPGNLQPVLDAIARSANRLCEGVFSALFRLEGETIQFSAHDGLAPEQLEAIRRVFPARASRDSMTGRAILDRQVVHIADVAGDPSYALMPLAREVGYRSFLSVPMSRGGVPVGAVSVARREPTPFTDRQIQLLETFADQAVIAIEGVRLFHEIREKSEALAALNATLEERVAAQVTQLERLGRLKRFFSPQLAELIVAGGAEDPLRTHRREVAVTFLDLRGFTAFAETAEPEEVMGVLREYHAEMGRLILAHEGTLERFTGDGMMIFFNDPVPVPNPGERAVRMALAMRERVAEMIAGWRRRGYELDLGIGIAQGYATIGAIGFEGRWDYGAIGTVTNLAARLCGEAKPGQILISRRLLATVDDLVLADALGDLTLKGFLKPVPAFNLLGLR
ncbi:MAG: GAF domain-containing protein [Candidatus Rokubacteria bacterium]|nr:GAF domain-containing protein [Candidatus Rokubacteria bacterium]